MGSDSIWKTQIIQGMCRAQRFMIALVLEPSVHFDSPARFSPLFFFFPLLSLNRSIFFYNVKLWEAARTRLAKQHTVNPRDFLCDTFGLPSWDSTKGGPQLCGFCSSFFFPPFHIARVQTQTARSSISTSHSPFPPLYYTLSHSFHLIS